MKKSDYLQLALKGWKLNEIKELSELEKTATDDDESNRGSGLPPKIEGDTSNDVPPSTGEGNEGVIDYKSECAKLEQKINELSSKLEKAQKMNTMSKVDSTGSDESDFDIITNLAKEF